MRCKSCFYPIEFVDDINTHTDVDIPIVTLMVYCAHCGFLLIQRALDIRLLMDLIPQSMEGLKNDHGQSIARHQ
jgi:hypothetical protein